MGSFWPRSVRIHLGVIHHSVYLSQNCLRPETTGRKAKLIEFGNRSVGVGGVPVGMLRGIFGPSV